MNKTVLAFVLTLFAGFIGVFLDSMLQLNGSLGVVFSIATIGAFIVSAIDDKRTK